MMFKKQDKRVYEARRAKLGLGKKTKKIGTRNAKQKAPYGAEPLDEIPGLYVRWYNRNQDDGCFVDANDEPVVLCPWCQKVGVQYKGGCPFCHAANTIVLNAALPSTGEYMNRFDPDDERSWGRVKRASLDEAGFRDFEMYRIEMDGNEKVMHIDHYSWVNGGRTAGGDDGFNEYNAPYTVTEYTFCEIPLKELVRLGSEERWDLISDYEANVSQYEGDYIWEDFVDFGYATPGNAKHLSYGDITMDTPCGDYYYYV